MYTRALYNTDLLLMLFNSIHLRVNSKYLRKYVALRKNELTYRDLWPPISVMCFFCLLAESTLACRISPTYKVQASSSAHGHFVYI